MRSGNLRNKITIQVNTLTQDAFGEPIESWATFAQPWAEIKSITGGERFTGDQDAAIGSVQFKIREMSGINERMRISWDSRLFDITYINKVFERNRDILLTCSEINNNG